LKENCESTYINYDNMIEWSIGATITSEPYRLAEWRNNTCSRWRM